MLKRLELVGNRLSNQLVDALALMNDGEKGPVQAAWHQWTAGQGGPYELWFTDVFGGHCRLPKLPALIVKTLLLTWLSPEVDRLARPVCIHCGLEYPQHCLPPMSEWKLLPGKTPWEGPAPWYDLPEFFPSCPGCGASRGDIDWARFSRETHRPWMAMDDCLIRNMDHEAN